MNTHDLLAEPEGCAECRARYHDWASMRAKDSPMPSFEQWEAAAIKFGYRHPHAAAQDLAIAQAVRAAAGSENPVRWALHITTDDRAGAWHDIAHELDKIVNPTGATT
jgi:hypothetical protein